MDRCDGRHDEIAAQQPDTCRLAARKDGETHHGDCRNGFQPGGAAEAKEIVRRFYKEVVSRCELERVGEYISPDCIVRIGDDAQLVGVEGMRAHIAATKETYPDYTMRIIRQMQDGDTVISEFIMTGTHSGVYLGIAPTGKVISITGVDIDTLADGKITEHGGAANTFEAFFENGLVKPVT